MFGDYMAKDIEDFLREGEDWAKAGPLLGCGNMRCPYGCTMGYEDVPEPHVGGTFLIAYEYEHGKGWGWEIEGMGVFVRRPTLLEAIEVVHNLIGEEAPYCEAQIGGMECGRPVSKWGHQCENHDPEGRLRNNGKEKDG